MPNHFVDGSGFGSAKDAGLSPKQKMHRDWSGAIAALCIGLLGLALGRLGWLRLQLDVFSALSVQAAILVITSGIGLLMPRYKTLSATILFFSAIVAYGLWPSLPVSADGPAPVGTKRLRISTFNIDNSDGREDAIVASLISLDADVALLQEYDGSPKLLAALAIAYPYLVACEDLSRCDVLIAARVPFKQKVNLLLPNGPSAIGMRFGAEYSDLLVVDVHGSRFPKSVKQFAETSVLARRLAQETGPMIIAGDFNATAQSRLVQDFSKSLDLQPMLTLPTYPTAYGLPQIAIDQILVRNGIVSIGPQLGGDAVGSDHIPVARSFAIPVQP